MTTDDSMRHAARAGFFPNGIVGRTIKVVLHPDDSTNIEEYGNEFVAQVMTHSFQGGYTSFLLLFPSGEITNFQPWVEPRAKVYLVS